MSHCMSGFVLFLNLVNVAKSALALARIDSASESRKSLTFSGVSMIDVKLDRWANVSNPHRFDSRCLFRMKHF